MSLCQAFDRQRSIFLADSLGRQIADHCVVTRLHHLLYRYRSVRVTTSGEARWHQSSAPCCGFAHNLAGALGSGLVDQSQKITVAARATAEKKTVGHRS